MKFEKFNQLVESYDNEKVEVDDNDFTGYILLNKENNECNVYDINDDVIFSMKADELLKQMCEYFDLPFEYEE